MCEPEPESVGARSKGSPALAEVLVPQQTCAALVLGQLQGGRGCSTGQVVFKAEKF